jgi:hypothetical protein
MSLYASATSMRFRAHPLSPAAAPEAIDHAPVWLRPSRDLDGYRAKKTVSMLKQ